MGGCCCSSRKPHFHGTPVYYYCPPSLEEHGSLISHGGAASAFTAGLLVELNLNTSTPDTFRPPPAPLPYDVVFGGPPSSDSESLRETMSRDSFETLEMDEDPVEPDRKIQGSSLPVSPHKSKVIRADEPVSLKTEEDDVCPICLEEYDSENPKLITKCEHHFHLPCILEWLERSDTCPICDQEIGLDHTSS
ncbi:Probable E3 ubiquitin-protein ligase RHB1A [Linum grandiflorum]